MAKNNMTETANTPEVSKKKIGVRGRKVMYAVFILLFVLVLAAINVLSVFLVDKFPSLELDFTSDSAYTLQNTTKEYLEYLDSSVTIKVLGSEAAVESYDSTYGYQVNQLLHDMDAYKNVTLEYMDIEMESVTALSEKYPDIDWQNMKEMLLVESDTTGKYEGVEPTEVFVLSMDYTTYEYYVSGQSVEKAVLSAIQRVTSEEIVKVAISTGNGEFLSEDHMYYSNYANFESMLGYNAYDVTRFNLLTESIPEDAEVLVMLGPTYDLTNDEVEKISKWLDNGGNMGRTLFYAPYYIPGNETPNIDLLLEQWGMSVAKGWIVEGDATRIVENGNAFLAKYSNEAFTSTLKDTSVSVVMGYDCLPVEISDTNMAKPMLTTSDKAKVMLLDTLEEDNSEPQYLDARAEGYNAAAISTKTASNGETSNIVVWGSAMSLSDSPMQMDVYNNQSYFINMMNTLSENEVEGVVVDGVKLEGKLMTVTDAHKMVFRILFVIIVPIALVVTGIVVWVRRRNR